MKETLSISGMSCGGCVASVKASLERAGAREAEVVVGKATVDYDESKVSHEQLVEAVIEAGFEISN